MSATDRIRALLPGASVRPWHAYPEPSGPDAGTWLNNGEVGMREHGVAIFPAEMNEQGPVDAALVKDLVNHAEALCDLADAARRVPDDGAVHSDDGNHKAFPTCARCGLEWPCPTSAIRDALTRLDGEDGP